MNTSQPCFARTVPPAFRILVLLCLVSMTSVSCAFLGVSPQSILVQFHPHNKILENMKGKNIEVAINQFGAPADISDYQLARHTWYTTRTVEHDGYWHTRSEFVDQYDKEGRYIGATWVDVEEYIYEPWTEELWCRTIIDATPEGVITYYQWSGNGCS